MNESRMSNLTEKLRYWRDKRNITAPDTKVYVANIIEELLEIYHTDKKVIKSKQKEIMEFYFDSNPLDENNTIDAIQDIQVFSINEVEIMGYDNIGCNQEVFKHIDCRKQDPVQYIEWQKNGAYGKWKKWEQQPDDELYEPDYESRKILG